MASDHHFDFSVFTPNQMDHIPRCIGEAVLQLREHERAMGYTSPSAWLATLEEMLDVLMKQPANAWRVG